MIKHIENGIFAVIFVQFLGAFIVASFIWPLYTIVPLLVILITFFCVMTFVR